MNLTLLRRPTSVLIFHLFLINVAICPVQANVYEMITTTGETGGDPVWKVVSQSDENETELKPGIYMRGPEHTWDKALIEGKVLGSEHSSGLMQLALSQTTRRLEAWAVVDGKIVIFNSNTSASESNSYIVLGSDDYPVIDPGQPYLSSINVPSIDSLEDIRVSTIPPSGYPRSQDILISIRDRNNRYQKHDGLSILLRVSGSNEGDFGRKIELNSTVFALDYQFHSCSELKDLEVNKHHFLSYSYLDHRLRLKSSDPLPIKVWKNGMLKAWKLGKLEGLPYFDAKSNEFHSDEPHLRFRTRNRRIAVGLSTLYHLNGQAPETRISTESEEKIIPGEVNFSGESELNEERTNLGALTSLGLVECANGNQTIAFINGELHFLEHSRLTGLSDIVLSPKPLSGEIPDVIAFSGDLGGGSTTSQSIILVSAKKGEKEETVAYMLRENGTTRVLDNAVSISSNFYPSEELSWRFSLDGIDDGFFDFLTPSTGKDTSDIYLAAYDKTKAHINLTKTLLKQSISYGFIEPKDLISLSEGCQYRWFNNEGSGSHFDGVYTLGDDDEFSLAHKGELLSFNAKVDEYEDGDSHDDDHSGRDKFILDEIEIKGPNGPFRVGVYAIDSDFLHGEKGYRLVYIIKPLDGHSQVETMTLGMSTPFSELLGIQLHADHMSPLFKKLSFVSLALTEDRSVGVRNIVKTDMTIERRQTTRRKSGSMHYIDSSTVRKELNSFNEKTGAEDFFRQTIVGANLGLVDGHLKVLSGEILSKGSIDAKAGVFQRALERKDIDHPKLGLLTISAYAIDEDFEGGKESFNLLLQMKRNKNGQVESYVKKIYMPFSDFVGLSLHAQPNVEKMSDQFGMIFALNPKAKNSTPNRPREKAGYYSTFFKVKYFDESYLQNIPKFFSSAYQTQLERQKDPSMEEQAYKLLVDLEGKYYWPQSDVPRSHRLYEVICLNNGHTVFPNQSGMILESAQQVAEEGTYAIPEGSWRVKKGTYIKTVLPGNFGKLRDSDLEEYRTPLFENLSESLQSLGDSHVKGEHKILLVSKELKKYISNTIAANWLMKNRKDAEWSFENRSLALYKMVGSNKLDQASIFSNFRAMEAANERGQKAVLLADIADLVQFSYPAPGNIDREYRVSIPFEEHVPMQRSGEISDLNSELNVRDEAPPASILYIFASEGQILSLEEFFKKKYSRNSIVLLGTPEEWQMLKDKIPSHEQAYGVFNSFKEIRLDTPSLERRRELLVKVLDDKARLFKGVRYDGRKVFSSDEKSSQQEIKEKLADYAVLRSQALAEEKKQNVFVSFVGLLNKFKGNLHGSLELDSEGNLSIDKSFIENILCDTYGLPLNLRSLPHDDPLKILSRKDAPMKLNEAGYAGNFDMKLRIFNGILGQTNSGDQKTIPASFVLFGKKGSGKTFFFKTLVKMLKLKHYDFSADSLTNEDSQVFLINLGNVTSNYSVRSNSSGETMTVSTMLDKFDEFLKMPKGRRGFILFDDAHLSSSEVRGEVFSKLRSLFEAKDGKYEGVSVRNLTLFMTYNPTIDRQKIRKVVEYGEPSPLELTLATFLSDDNKVDESFFNRWGEIINLDYFGTSAKGSELINRLGETAKSQFNLENNYFTVSSDVIWKIVNRFPTLNARDFLSVTVKSLASMLKKDGVGSDLSLIVPQGKLPIDGIWNEGNRRGSSDAKAEEVRDYIESGFTTLGINDDLRGFVYFLEMLTNNFRANLYRDFIAGLNNSEAMMGNQVLQRYKLSPTLQAIKSHLKSHPKIPLTAFSLDQGRIKKNLGFLSSQGLDQEINGIYLEASNEQKRYFPEVFQRPYRDEQLASGLMGRSLEKVIPPSRLSLLHDTPDLISSPLKDYVERLLGMDLKRKSAHFDVRKWALNLKGAQSVDLITAMEALVSELGVFMSSFYGNQNFIENIMPEDYAEGTVYDSVRVFLYVLDQSITHLCWEQISINLVQILESFSSDMSIATHSGSQHWLFDAQKTLIRPQSIDNIYESIKSSLLGIGEWSKDQESSFSSEFSRKLGELFYSKGSRKDEASE